jgi:hypothetical protein
MGGVVLRAPGNSVAWCAILVLNACGAKTLPGAAPDDAGSDVTASADHDAAGALDASTTTDAAGMPEASGNEAAAQERDATADAALDAAPSFPCLQRPAADCSCIGDGRCTQSAAALFAIEATVSGCTLACGNNSFSFDGDGCLTKYVSSSPALPSGEACILAAMDQVRVPCAAGLAQPVNVFWSCGPQ